MRIVSDGDLMEGVASEAASLAGHLKLGKLVYLYDNNRISLAARPISAFTEDCAKTLRGLRLAYGIRRGRQRYRRDRSRACARPARSRSRPSLILLRTHIGYGSPGKQDSFEAHGSPLGEAEVKRTKENLGWPLEPSFYIPEEASARFHEGFAQRRNRRGELETALQRVRGEISGASQRIEQSLSEALPTGWEASIPSFPPTRRAWRRAPPREKFSNCDRDQAADPDRRFGGFKSVDVHGADEAG